MPHDTVAHEFVQLTAMETNDLVRGLKITDGILGGLAAIHRRQKVQKLTQNGILILRYFCR